MATINLRKENPKTIIAKTLNSCASVLSVFNNTVQLIKVFTIKTKLQLY